MSVPITVRRFPTRFGTTCAIDMREGMTTLRIPLADKEENLAYPTVKPRENLLIVSERIVEETE